MLIVILNQDEKCYSIIAFFLTNPGTFKSKRSEGYTARKLWHMGRNLLIDNQIMSLIAWKMHI